MIVPEFFRPAVNSMAGSARVKAATEAVAALNPGPARPARDLCPLGAAFWQAGCQLQGVMEVAG
jgi:hypothetical protein